MARDPAQFLQQQFKAFVDEINEASIEVVQDIASKILADAKVLAPFDTGALQSTGKVTVFSRGDKKEITGVVSFGGSSFVGRNTPNGIVFYAGAVHASKPFLLEAIQINQSALEGIATEKFREVARKRTRGGGSRASPPKK